MASDLFIEKKYARVQRTEKEHCTKHGVRLYHESPVSAVLQIRTSTAKRGVYATTSLNADECRALAETLLGIASELSPDV